MDNQHAPKLGLNQLCDQVASLCFETSSTKQTMDDQHPPKLGLNQLCETCVDNIFPKDREWQWLKEGFDDKPEEEKLIGPFTLKRLLEAVKTGCHFCTIVSESIRQMEDLLRPRGYGDLWGTQERYFLLPHCDSRSYAWFEIDFKLGMKVQYQNFSIDVSPATVLNQDDSYQYSHFRYGKMVQNQSYTNLSEQTFDQVRQWLQTCQQTHTMCNTRSGSEPQLGRPPVRFIDLGVDATHPVRLVDRQLTGDDKPVYITLSYRWTAEIEMSQTTQANKHIHYDAIPVSRWPQVYKDTASIARRLGVRYIWIDALCIIQGDHKDWSEQSQMMDMVYTNGFLNLAAILGEESPGLECYRNPLSIMPCVVTRVSSKGNGAGETSHWMLKMDDSFEYSVPYAPLYKRGWTLQERALSTRTLHCGKQLYWECMASTAPESFPSLHFQDRKMLISTWGNPVQCLKSVLSDDGFFRTFGSEKDPRPQPPIHSRHLRRHRQPGLDSHKTVVNIWNDVVEAFSAMSLTKPSDKLVALRGIVNRLQGQLEDAEVVSQYASGLWKIGIFFEQQLCWWMSERYAPPRPELDHDLAKHFPSWSWAACGNRLSFPTIMESRETRRLAKLESLHGTDDNTTDPLGPARIVLRGALIPFINAEKILTDGLRQPVVSWTEENPLKESSMWIRFEAMYPDKPIDAEAKKKKLKLLPLYYDYYHGVCTMEGHVYGLLLDCVGTHDGRSLYRRFGMFMSDRTTAREFDGLEDLFSLDKAIKSGKLFGPREVTLADLDKVIEVDGSDELNYENRWIDWIFDIAEEEEAVDGIPKELYEKLLKEPQICLI
ncbi:heterokaryon incompatibility protein-domain-containing protein [Neurospora tetraspora]|uniref:Heterokaryon incompatibility protein-domain-containing protein n=1 Tax=Neurospora tetraspora TaxID=94610 RepID=A0AAE0J0X0_9PEZI|nr:heterokaryon incompatibility protein-domain-containing protein [Neurospora tetraspora]